MKAVCGNCQQFKKGCIVHAGCLICPDCYYKDTGEFPTEQQMTGRSEPAWTHRDPPKTKEQRQ